MTILATGLLSGCHKDDAAPGTANTSSSNPFVGSWKGVPTPGGAMASAPAMKLDLKDDHTFMLKVGGEIDGKCVAAV